MNDNITELFSVEIAGGLRKDSVTFVPDDVVITIPIDGACGVRFEFRSVDFCAVLCLIQFCSVSVLFLN